jgi:hypothetical protein
MPQLQTLALFVFQVIILFRLVGRLALVVRLEALVEPVEPARLAGLAVAGRVRLESLAALAERGLLAAQAAQAALGRAVQLVLLVQ